MKVQPSTVKDLEGMAECLKQSISESATQLEAVQLVLELAQKNVRPNAVRHRETSLAGKVEDAIREMLAEGPMHRRDILSRLQAQGLEFMGKTDPLRVLAKYLSQSNSAESAGKGVWRRVDTPKPVQTFVERRKRRMAA